MQIQKHLFRISQRSLKNPNAKCFTTCAFLVTLFGCIYYSLIFIVGNLYVLPTNNHISECFKMSKTESNFNVELDAIYMVFPTDLGKITLSEARRNNHTVSDNSICSIIKDLNTKDISQKQFEFTWTPNALYLTTQQRHIYNFTNYTIVFNQIPATKYFLYGMNNLLTNELVYNSQNTFQPNVYIRSSTIQINTPLPTTLNIKEKIFKIVKSFIFYVVTSIVTSLYIYGTIIAAPAVIIIFLRCSQFVNNGGNMTEVYKIFPWIGMHSLIRESSQNQKIKRSGKEICCAIIMYFFFLYFVYYAIIIQLSNDIFYQKSEQGLQEMLFGFIALIEFMSIVFMRTRPFIKYFPAIHTLMIMMFLVYCQFSTFGLKKHLMMVVTTASLSLFCLMVLELEIPAQTTWNRTKSYTPSVQRPRIGFLPLFNINWINSLPDQWTMMFPLFGRQSFSERELSFVDRNFQVLDGVLGVNNNNNNNAQQQQQQQQLAGQNQLGQQFAV